MKETMKKHFNQKGSGAAALIVLLALAVGGFLIFSAINNSNDQNGNTNENLAVNNTSMQDAMNAGIMIKDEGVMTKDEFDASEVREKVVRNSATLIANLVDVSGGDSYGKGYILRDEEKLYHYVEGNLPDPEGTNMYEGWLVKTQPELMFFSTGVMEKSTNETYTLTYVSEQISEGFDFVVITEETVIDEIPEKHIIEAVAMKSVTFDDSGKMMKDEGVVVMADSEKTNLVTKAMNAENALVADLEDVTGGNLNLSGTGYVLRESGMLYHYAVADLPTPTGNNVYEGWLVKRQPELMFFSTGVMELNEENNYELMYTSNNESIDFDFVVITEETSVTDNTPEIHIIEGLAV